MVSKLKTICNIFKSELKKIFTDKGTILIMVGGIFLYGIFYMIPYHNHIARDISIGVIDNDNSKLSREFSRNIETNQYIHIKTKLYDLEDAKKEYYKDNIKGFVVIPKDFEKDTKRGKNTFIATYLDSAYLTVYKQLITGINEVTVSFSTKLSVKNLIKKGMNEETAKLKAMPYEIVSNALYNPIGSYQNYIYPLVLIMILQQTMLIGITMLNGTIVENKRKFSEFSDNPKFIIIGKSLAYCSLYLIYSIIYFLIFPAIVTYNMTYRIIPILLILLPFLFSVSLLGQSMLWICRTRECSLLLLIPSSVPFIFLPGFVWPLESMPNFLVYVSKFIPTTSAIDALVKINQMNSDLKYVLNDFVILILLCILYYYLSYSAIKYIKNK